MSRQQETRKGKSNQAPAKDPQPAPSNPPPGSIADYLEWFLLDQRSQKHSASTLFFYKRYVNHFIWYLKHKQYPTDLAAITANHIRAFFVYLQEDTQGRWGKQTTVTCKPLKPAAVHAFARALRAFFNWASQEAEIANPFDKVAMPKLPDAWKVQTYTDEEIAALFAACDQSEGPKMIARNRAILALLLDSGIRASELLGLEVSDVDLISGVFHVRGKGAKERAVVIGSFARRELRTHLQYRAAAGSTERALFLSMEGTPLTYNGLKELFNRLQERTGITRVQVKAHNCRHTAATLMHRHGMRGETIQELLGHSSFDTTRRYYLDVTEEDLAREHEAHGPLDALSLKKPKQGTAIGKGRVAAAKLPSAEQLAKEVAASTYRAVARKYQVSDTTIRKRLQQAGLL